MTYKSVTACALALALAAPTTVVAHGANIPLGDGKVASQPRVDYVTACQTRFNPNAPGAGRAGDWIKGDYWVPDLKPTVNGAVSWTGGGLEMALSGSKRRLTGRGLPGHSTGVFPVSRTDDAYQYDRNPNRIAAQKISLTLPANPKIAPRASCLPMGMIGVSLTGVAIFNALDAPGRDAVAHEIQDTCGGHPERRGQYHYHGPSDCMTEAAKGPNGHSGLVGYALDGFGIFGMNGAAGKHLSNADLDACHGHTEAVLWDGKVTKIYHYHLTDEYPYTLGCFKGQPVRAR